MITSQFKITGAKGFHLTFPNGWTASVQWGAGNYCDNYDSSFTRVPANLESTTAECAAWGPAGKMVDLLDQGDTVLGHQDTAEVLAFLNLVASQPSRSVDHVS